MDEFTAANIAVSDEKREEEMEKIKKGQVDYSNVENEIADAKSRAKQVQRLNTRHKALDIRNNFFDA